MVFRIRTGFEAKSLQFSVGVKGVADFLEFLAVNARGKYERHRALRFEALPTKDDRPATPRQVRFLASLLIERDEDIERLRGHR